MSTIEGDDPTTTEHTPTGVHSVVRMPATPLPTIESAGRDQDNAMGALESPDGDLFYPDNPDDALLFHLEYGVVPLHPERWPWPGVLVPARPDAGEFCPEPTACFPYGLPAGTTAAACIHTGGVTHWIGDESE